MKKVVYISDILSFISCNNHHKNLLVLDIDNTILKGSTSLGSDQWYSWQCQLIKQKSKYSVAYDIEHLNKIINEMYSHLVYELCEPELPNTLFLLKKLGLDIVLLTARGSDCHDYLLKTLKQLNVFPYLMTSCRNHLGGYQDGIIYCQGSHKGNILKLFLEQHDYNPEQIIFVDDKLKNLEHVNEILPQTQLFLCTHQSENVHSFNQSNKQEVIQEYQDYLYKKKK